MRRALHVLIISSVLLLPSWAFAGDLRKLRWVNSIYSDAAGGELNRPEGVACSEDSFVVADTGNSRLLSYRYSDEAVLPTAAFPLPRSMPLVVQMNSKGDFYFLDGRVRRIVVVGPAGEARGAVTPKGVRSPKKIIPKSFRIDADDNIYILDIFAERVLVLDPQGGLLRRLPFPDGHGFLSDLAVGPAGKIFVLDSVEAAVYSAATGAKEFSRLGEGMKEYMNFPTRLEADDRGILYLIDQHGSGLALVSQDGEFLGRRLGMGWNESLLYYPSQICVSRGGNVGIADRNNNRVQVFRLMGE